MGNLVLTREPGESIDIYDPDNAAIGVIVITQGKIRGKHSSIAIDAPRHLHVKRSEISDKKAEPVIEENQPITKKLIDILVENNDLDLQVIAIKRGKPKMVILYPNMPMLPSIGNSEMTWNEDWNAWSNRPESGVYQQIIIFMPRVDA